MAQGGTYREKLLDPRWQRKRLEVLERAGWACESCGDKESTLHVHHGCYGPGEPWEAPAGTLWCLCEACHEEIGNTLRDCKLELGRVHPRLLVDVLWVIHNAARRGEGYVNDLGRLNWAYSAADRSKV